MNKLDRIKILINNLIVRGVEDTQKGFGVKLGYSNESSFSQILNGNVNMPKNFIKKLKSVVPLLNVKWIETGEGEMFENHNFFVNNGQHGDGSIRIQGNSNGNIIAGSNIRTSNSNNRNIEDKKQKECLLCKEKDQLIRSLELQLQVRQEQLQDKNEQLQAKDKIINSLIDKIK